MNGSHESLLHWQSNMLGRGGARTEDIVHEYCRFLNGCGMRLCRVNLALTTLHPQIQALRYVWYDDLRDPGPFPSPTLFRRSVHHLDGCTLDEALMSYGARDTAPYRKSPFYRLHLGERFISYPLSRSARHDYAVLDDLAAAGATHYVAYAFDVHEGQISFATRAEGGFDPASTAFIQESLTCLASLLQGSVGDLILDTVLECYVGPSAGREIRHGNIRPGAMLDLGGAIWFSDIRGYSRMSRSENPQAFIDKLNAYYELVVPRILAEGGEVLKFIGDSILAIFVEEGDSRNSCERALSAAIASNLALREQESAFEHGIGLHLGRFRFGNIGSLRRLDFTVIGDDVNFASRIEAQCGPNRCPLLMSQPFAERCGQPVRLRSTTPLKGFDGEFALFEAAE